MTPEERAGYERAARRLLTADALDDTDNTSGGNL
jgi:hypothetical protein